MIVAARATLYLPLLLSPQLRTPSTRLCVDDPLKRAAETSGDAVDLSAAAEASSQLEGLAEGAARRLVELGAAEVAPPPPPQGLQRSSFQRSETSEAQRQEMDERLQRLRLKGTGALEEPNLAAIEEARKMARQWDQAGLPKRAKQELLKVEPFCSLTTDVGASFHLQLADAHRASGEKLQARRLQQKVMSEAASSALRWQAEKSLEASNPSKPPSSSQSSGPANPEMSQLWNMPKW